MKNASILRQVKDTNPVSMETQQVGCILFCFILKINFGTKSALFFLFFFFVSSLASTVNKRFHPDPNRSCSSLCLNKWENEWNFFDVIFLLLFLTPPPRAPLLSLTQVCRRFAEPQPLRHISGKALQRWSGPVLSALVQIWQRGEHFKQLQFSPLWTTDSLFSSSFIKKKKPRHI